MLASLENASILEPGQDISLNVKPPGPVFCLLLRVSSCSANNRAGYFTNLACDWLSIVWAFSEQGTEMGPDPWFSIYRSSFYDAQTTLSCAIRHNPKMFHHDCLQVCVTTQPACMPLASRSDPVAELFRVLARESECAISPGTKPSGVVGAGTFMYLCAKACLGKPWNGFP